MRVKNSKEIREFIKKQNSASLIWNSLSETEKKEVQLSYKESENEANLKSWEELKKKY